MVKDQPESALFRQFAGELISARRSFRFQAKGRSMLPTIEDGEILHVMPISNRNIRTGDIVFFRNGAEFKAHRVIAKKRQSFVTRGDAGIQADGEIMRDQILGVVSAKECCRTARVVRLCGVASRSRFFLSETCKRVSIFLRQLQYRITA